MVVADRPVTRGPTDQRRRRLHEILARESTPGGGHLRPSKSLPALETARPQPHQLAPCPSPVLTKCTPNLSPLRSQRQRPATRQLTLRTARQDLFTADQDTDGAVTTPEDAPGSASTDDAKARIEHEAALARHADEWETQHARAVARQYKAGQLEQIQDKQLRRRDRKLDAQQVAEQIAWEQTQFELADQSRRHARHSQLLALRESQLHSLELDRRQASAAKIARDFFDRLAVLDAAAAMAMFEAKQDALVACCLELVQECVERHELDDFKEMLRETLQKEELLLRHRVRAAQREEEARAAKQRAVTDLKRTQYEEIQRHLALTREGKSQQRLLRSEVDRQQETLDTRYRAKQDVKKQRERENGAKLQQQMRRHRAEQAVVTLRVDGMASPTLRTPFWSDESTEARVDTYERQSRTATSPGRPTIFAKKTCQWYD